MERGTKARYAYVIEDEEMRHGRKSKSKRFNGYKQHIGTHLDAELVLACTVTPANHLHS